MQKLYYNEQGWVCERYPYQFAIENEDLFLMVDEEAYRNSFTSEKGMAWRVVNSKLEQQVYDERVYQEEQIIQEICTLKKEMQQAKEDVEQVELFGMERSDYVQKKARCIEIIESLRVLEQQLKELSKEGE